MRLRAGMGSFEWTTDPAASRALRSLALTPRQEFLGPLSEMRVRNWQAGEQRTLVSKPYPKAPHRVHLA